MPITKPRLAALAAASAAAVLILAGCSAAPADAGQANGSGDGLSVVATTTQVADFTRNVVGDTPGTSVTQLIQPNQSAHSYDPSAADLAVLAEADVLVINGVGLESWLDDAIEASGFDGATVDADHGVVIQDADGHEDETESSETETGEAGHDHSSGNPHIWTDVQNAQAMVTTIADGLASASDAHADAFRASADAYTGKLAELDAWIRANVDTVPAPSRLLVANHDALGYFTAAYGITYVGSIIPSFDDNAEPSAAQIDELVSAIKKAGVTAVFSEASVSPKTARTIAGEAGVEVFSGEDALYVDSLGPDGSPGETYISSQVHNVTAILRSWGVSPSPVPAGLEP
ncbi:MAG TPA: metal ABC transporter substrate-binding protein [Glaciibacter sp.]|nr:metal ABC transporter substrate-binding protein [Glaciibacter sp.]